MKIKGIVKALYALENKTRLTGETYQRQLMVLEIPDEGEQHYVYAAAFDQDAVTASQLQVGSTVEARLHLSTYTSRTGYVNQMASVSEVKCFASRASLASEK